MNATTFNQDAVNTLLDISRRWVHMTGAQRNAAGKKRKKLEREYPGICAHAYKLLDDERTAAKLRSTH